MTDETVQFSATQQAGGDGAPGATAAFPYDRMTVERFRAAFPRARWCEDLGAWSAPGTTAERRLSAWSSREWPGVLAYADERGRNSFTFEPITSAYLEVADDLVVQTPYFRAVVRAVQSRNCASAGRTSRTLPTRQRQSSGENARHVALCVPTMLA